jgi:restriction system protein
LATWAEIQRNQRRQRERQERIHLAQQQEMVRAQRAAARAQARDERESRRLYQEYREVDAAQRTNSIAAQVSTLNAVLAAGLDSPPPRLESLKVSTALPPYDPGPLAVPVIPPDPRQYEPAAPTGLQALAPAVRRQHEQNRQAARARFENDWRAAQRNENERLQRLALAQQRYRDWAEAERRRIIEHNRRVDELARQATRADADAIPEFFAALLRLSSQWPTGFPTKTEVAWDGEGLQLLVSRELPSIQVVPPVTRIRYVKSDDRELEIKRPVGERREVYRRVLAQCALRVVWEVLRARLFRQDGQPLVQSVVFNGYVVQPDPATGNEGSAYLITLMASRATFEQIDLSQADPVQCVEGLKGQLSARPDKAAQVRPIRLLSSLDSAVTQDGETGEKIDLLGMDPGGFEELVAELFSAMGLQTQTTARTGDGGVDVIAVDPDPIRGGRMVIQVKRYDSTIPPSVVRDLYGTVLHEGAIKGILVTTAGFGPSSHQFAQGKPLTLINGTELLALLAKHGLTAGIA